jgi:hypothetical protein
MLRDCEVCNRRFAVNTILTLPGSPAAPTAFTCATLRCPSCGHLNPLVMLMYAHHASW